MVTEIPYLKKIFVGSNFWGGTETSFKVIKEQLKRIGINVLVNNHSNSFDIIHIYTYFLLSFYIMIRFKGKKPIVIHSNTTPADIRMSVPFDSIILSLAKPYLKRFYNLADLIICISDYAKDSLKKLGITTKMIVIPHGINLDYMKYSKEKRKKFRHRFNLRDDVPVILSVGHLIPRKGLKTFVYLAKKLPNVNFFWVGPFLISMDPNIANIIKNKPKNLFFTGYLDDIISAYSACDIFLFPSYSENFGIPIIEAAACKKPVIVRDIPSYSWLQHNFNCLKAKDDTEFLKNIKKLLKNKIIREKIIKEGFKTAVKHDIKKIVKKFVNNYYQLLSMYK
jgi:1,2-diacylglycerol-3-alpha-glucose alpha-1,2-glucosyltransferase